MTDTDMMRSYRKITADLDGGDTVDLIVDPAKRKPASWDGTYRPTLDIGYGRPEFRRIPLGYFGDNLILTDGPVELVTVWYVVGLDNGQPRAQIASPLMRSEHPTRYDVISGLWSKQS